MNNYGGHQPIRACLFAIALRMRMRCISDYIAQCSKHILWNEEQVLRSERESVLVEWLFQIDSPYPYKYQSPPGRNDSDGDENRGGNRIIQWDWPCSSKRADQQGETHLYYIHFTIPVESNLDSYQGWHVIIAARSFSKAEIAAKTEGLPVGSYTVMPLDLASLSSVRQFVAQLDSQPRQINALVCNAAVWYPRDTSPRLTADGYEEHVGTNHLAHFLLASLMVQKLKPADNYDPRIVFLGTDTHNPDSIAGKIPPQADLGDLSGLTGSGKRALLELYSFLR